MFSNKSDVYLFSFQCSVSARLPDCLSIIPKISELVKCFYKKNFHFLKKYEINVDLKCAFSLYFYGGFCYKKKWTMKRGGLDGQSRATHNK